MIYIGDHDSETIFMGSISPSVIYIGDFETWPSGYYYTLEYKSMSYSSGSALYPSGSNYATFSCYYRKRKRSNNSVVETTTVTATPQASYCVADGTKLRYNYDTYKDVTVAAGTQNVRLTYNGLVISSGVSVSLNANQMTYRSTITSIVPNSSSFPARGGETTYTGGVYTTYKHWSSGYEIFDSTGDAAFNNEHAIAYNSADNSFSAYVVPYTKTIYVPTLGTTLVSAGTYSFTSNSYNGTTVSFSVSQEANAIDPSRSTSSGKFYDASNNEITGGMFIDTSQQTLLLTLKVSRHTVYTSDASVDSTSSINTSDCSYGYTNTSVQSGPITNVYGYNQQFQISISRNTTGNARSAVFWVVYSGNTYYANITQERAQVSYYYRLTDASLSYSSNNKLTANGNNYCYWTANYKTYNALDDSLVSTVSVKPIPAASYFKNYDSSLYFDYNEYKAYEISSGTKTATLTYGDASTTGTFSFEGNAITSSSHYFTPVVLDTSTFSAAGGDSSYSGGDCVVTNNWRSGYSENITYSVYSYVGTHPQASSKISYANRSNHSLVVPSLEKIETTAATITLTGTHNSYSNTFTITQAANVKSAAGATTYSVINVDTGTNMNSYYQCAASFEGNIRVRVDMTTGGYTYSSGMSDPGSTTTGITVTPTIQYQSSSFISMSPNATSDVFIYIPRNTSGTSRNAQITFSYGGTMVAGLYISQSGT